MAIFTLYLLTFLILFHINVYSFIVISKFRSLKCQSGLNQYPVKRANSAFQNQRYNSRSSQGNKNGFKNNLFNWNANSPRFDKTVKINPEFKLPIDSLKLSDKTLGVLLGKGFTELTPIQSHSFDMIYSGENVIARSRTGTGKTFAFGLPLIEQLINKTYTGKSHQSKVLILEPTRELSVQVAQELSSLGKVHGIKVFAVYGGVSYVMQERTLYEGVDIIVATPGRALDHISRGSLDLSMIKHVVLDEGDIMLEMGFQKSVEAILANIESPSDGSRKIAQDILRKSNNKFRSSDMSEENDLEINFDTPFSPNRDLQVLLFSATMPAWIYDITKKYMQNATFLDAVQDGENRLATSINHIAINLHRHMDRVDAISKHIEDLILAKSGGGQTIVFTNTKEEADRLAGIDCFNQLKPQVLHGDIGQASRQITIHQFKNKKIDVLIATDVAARGLDIAGVDLVVHLCPPMDIDSFVHRSGRTGRAGRNGTSVLLYSDVEERRVKQLEKSLNFGFSSERLPTIEHISFSNAQLAEKKIAKVNENVLKYFLPHAQKLVDQSEKFNSEENTAYVPSLLNSIDGENEIGSNLPTQEELSDEQSSKGYSNMDVLVAKLLAALSNKYSIQHRSLITGQEGFQTLEIHVLESQRNPLIFSDRIGSWLSYISNVLQKFLGLTEVQFHKCLLAKGGKNKIFLVVDFKEDVAQSILASFEKYAGAQMTKEGPIQLDISIQPCVSYPEQLLSLDRPHNSNDHNYNTQTAGRGRFRDRRYNGYDQLKSGPPMRRFRGRRDYDPSVNRRRAY